MFNYYFKGKTVLVTGAASGVGFALAKTLLSADAACVTLADINEEKLKCCVDVLNREYPKKALAMKIDVTEKDQVCYMIDEAVRQMGSLDLLINNAGTSFMGFFSEHPSQEKLPKEYVDSITDEDWDKMFKLNFWAALYACRQAIPYMLKEGGGQIVNVTSGIAFTPFPFMTPYSATKAALNAFTLSLRAEYASTNIKVNSVTPGTTATAIWQKKTPEGAQTPMESAMKILDAVVANKRLSYGDEGDVSGSTSSLAENQDDVDAYCANFVKNLLETGNFIL